MTPREYLANVREVLSVIGLQLTEDGTDAVIALYEADASDLMAAGTITLQNVALDYLRDAIAMVRGAETAVLLLKLLKSGDIAETRSHEDMETLQSLLAPFLSPSPETTNIANVALERTGSTPFSTCVRSESSFQSQARETIRSAYADYSRKRSFLGRLIGLVSGPK